MMECDIVLANRIWSELNLIKNQDKGREEQIDLIIPIISKALDEHRKLGRRQILNYLDDELKGLRKDS